jgi:HEAT repeat protein
MKTPEQSSFQSFGVAQMFGPTPLKLSASPVEGTDIGGMEPRVAELIEGLKDTNPTVRYHAAQELGNIGPAAAAAAPALTDALKDSKGNVRIEAAFALGNIGPAATAAAPALSELLKDASPDVRYRAAEALKAIRSAAD